MRASFPLQAFLSTSLFHSISSKPIPSPSPVSSQHQDSNTTYPTIKIGSTTYVGYADETTGIEAFRGLPFASPPVGDLRLMPPEKYGRHDKKNGKEKRVEALKDPNACMATNSTVGEIPMKKELQDALGLALQYRGSRALFTLKPDLSTTFLHSIKTSPAAKALGARSSTSFQSEDCLYLNVHRPASTSSKQLLPVVIFIFGGGFESGQLGLYKPEPIIQRSVEIGKPIIYVAMQYRLGAYGFLNGQQVLDNSKANLGLLDQRMAIQFVHDHIKKFGGDPEKVTLMGESAGAISIGLHLTSEGEEETDLYRAVILESGSPGHLYESKTHNQAYDIMANFTGCSEAKDGNSFKCLQKSDKFAEAMNQVPSSKSTEGLGLLFSPAVDGLGGYLPDYPDMLVQQGKYKKEVAILNGDEKDEGTYLTLGYTSNITTDEDFESYIRDILLPGISAEDLQTLTTLYPSDPAVGSPYETGDQWNITGQNKRVSSFYGDLNFWTPRRNLLKYASMSKSSKVYSYIHETFEDVPYLGGFHATDLVNTFGLLKSKMTTEILSRWVSFITDLDPNPRLEGLELIHWPKYGSDGKVLFFEREDSRVGLDNLRREHTDALQRIAGGLTGPIG